MKETRIASLPAFLYGELDSTNEEAKRRIREGTAGPFLILSDTQTAGKGRLGRRFYSPKDTGLYYTLALPKTLISGVFQNLPCRVSVAVQRAVLVVTGADCGIKWVNDLYYDRKKVGGILIEVSGETTVIGVGINLSTDSFPGGLAETAGPVLSKTARGADLREPLAEKLTEEILLEAALPDSSWLPYYRSKSFFLGKHISYGNVSQDGVFYEANFGEAEKVDEDGSLVVRLQNGERVRLRTGEISIRIK